MRIERLISILELQCNEVRLLYSRSKTSSPFTLLNASLEYAAGLSRVPSPPIMALEMVHET